MVQQVATHVMKGSLKLITVSLRDFALPAPRVGSLDPHSGYGRSAAEGQEIHLKVQKRRLLADPSYQAEVPVATLLERGDYRFRVEGRMDGIFRRTPARIEEIKSTFDLRELSRRLALDPFAHPYALQLLSYGYIHFREQGEIPELSFHLVSTRTSESLDLELPLDLERYETWLSLRLDELVLEAQMGERRAQRRRKLATGFPFPFAAPRPGQVELMREIEEGMAQRRPLLLQAPTGMGKTVGVLYPVLKEALGRGQRVVYVTPKNSLHSVAEDAVARFKEVGARVKSLAITAKGKICFQDEPLCDAASCEFARDYYEKLQRHQVLELLAKKRRLSARAFRQAGEEFRVCPFELQLELAPEADVVICDYNYVFAPRSASARIAGARVDQEGKPNLVIDEAHNLPGRAMDQYSPVLSSSVLEGLRPELAALPGRFRRRAEELLEGCLAAVASCGAGLKRPARVEPAVERFQEQEGKVRLFLSRYLEADHELAPDDPVLRLSHLWSSFTEALVFLADPERDEFFATFHPHAGGGTLKITCCDASAMLKGCYQEYGQVVAFSATLKPFDYYAKLSGMDPGKVRCQEFPSPFPRELRKLMIIPQVSTRYSRREQNYGKIADAVARIAAVRPGNYFVFFPSFDFLDRVAAQFRLPEGFSLLLQERRMPAASVEALLERLRGGEPTLAFGVQGGSFSEGVDYAGDMLVGAFVVGPPLPGYDLEREEMKKYYERRYGCGFQYAYGIPAMARAVQSAGRVIRSEKEQGLIVLMDDRFLHPDYTSAMPSDWFDTEATELVSGSILAEVEEFWRR